MAEDWSRPVVHWEIQAKDADRMSAFYSAMFNWSVGDGRVRDISAGIGAPETITGHIRPSGRSGVVLYIQVLKLRAGSYFGYACQSRAAISCARSSRSSASRA